MKHLTDAELVDLVDAGRGENTDASHGGTRTDADLRYSALPADRLRHLDSCEACRSRAGSLQATLAETRLDRAPEPSPLFWDFFAARVADAIRDETPAAAAASVAPWRQHPLTQWAFAATIAALVMLTLVWRATLHAPAPAGPASVAAVTSAPGPFLDAAASDLAAPDDVEQDEAWAVVRTAAEGFRWEDAHAVGIAAGPGAAEGLALELTADQRAELARLIDSEMKRSGA